jgi:hypothetical protein
MKMNEAFPSKYLKADVDVPEDSDVVLVINDASMETLGQGKEAEEKVILYFNGTDKGLVLNKTNWGLIAKALGSDDTDDWTGKAISLYSTDVQFGNDFVRSIRVRPRAPKPTRRQPVEVPDEVEEVPAHRREPRGKSVSSGLPVAETEAIDDGAPF